MSNTTTQQVEPPNPTGRGGFGDHPENRNPGGWKKELVFSYQYRRFMNMTVTELRAYAEVPESERTVVEDLAYSRVLDAKKSLPDVKEITDRTEGKPIQTVDMNLSNDHDSTEDKIKEFLDGRKQATNDQRSQPIAPDGQDGGATDPPVTPTV